MQKFVQHTGIVAPVLRDNIDTDAIIPSREMTRVSRQGLAEGLFAGWRYLSMDSREPDPSFVLNQPGLGAASILLAGDNFGCGSSREHAVWALAEYGVRAIIATGFGSIFAGNCVRNGLLPLVLPEPAVLETAAWVDGNPTGHRVTIDLIEQTVLAGECSYTFDIEPDAKNMLVNGLDAIALTQTRWDTILDFHQKRRSLRPWLYS